MGIMDIFKKNVKPQEIKNKPQENSNEIKFTPINLSYEEQITDLHEKGMPLNQAILRLSNSNGFNQDDILNIFSLSNDSFNGGKVHFFKDKTALLEKEGNLLFNKEVRKLSDVKHGFVKSKKETSLEEVRKDLIVGNKLESDVENIFEEDISSIIDDVNTRIDVEKKVKSLESKHLVEDSPILEMESQNKKTNRKSSFSLRR